MSPAASIYVETLRSLLEENFSIKETVGRIIKTEAQKVKQKGILFLILFSYFDLKP